MSATREQEFDGPWKGALEAGFDLFLGLFLDDLHAIADWTKDHISLDQELQQLTPASATGVRRVDKLFKVIREGTGDPRFFHVEAQAQPQPEEEFGERMYFYNYRGRDLLGQPLISIAILSNDQPDWHPRKYEEGEHGSKVTFTFRTVKVLQWADRQAELEAGDNLFGLFVFAHLEAVKARDDPDSRFEGKRRLLSNLASRALTDLERGKWYNVIDWILPLPEDMERQLFQQLKGDRPVTFISYAERVGMEKGEQTALLRTLRAALKAKFGDEGEALLAQLPEQTPVARLEELIVVVAGVTAFSDLPPHFGKG